MNIAKFNLVFLLTSCLLLVTTFSVQSAEKDDAALNDLKEYIQAFDNIQATFQQKVYGLSGDLLESATGIFALKKPGKFYWEYQQPYRQFLISNGMVIWIYDEDLEQVSINTIDHSIQNSPAAILGGGVEIEENYIVSDIGMRDGSNWIELVSNQEDAEFNAIRLGFLREELSGMILFDNLGQITELLFFDVLRNRNVDENLFEFNPPEGIDIIDSREQ